MTKPNDKTVDVPTCPHCGTPLSRMEMPDEAAYETDFMFVCFNDECPYYVKGWKWMWERYQVKSSYRHRVNPITGAASPQPVWSPDALKDRILP